MRSFGLVGLGILASGLLVNAYLAIVARSVPAAEYAYFGAFWSLTQVVGFGAFLSVEQETARLLQMPGRGAGVLKSVLLTAAWMAAAELAVIALGWPVVLRAFGGHPATVLALVVLCIVSAGQFVVRGALIGHDRLGRHAAIMVVDSMLRVGFAALVAATVATPGSPAFAWTLVAAIVCAHAPQLLALLTRTPRRARPVSDRIDGKSVWSAVAPLLLGSLCAQLMLNGPPVLVPALATDVASATRAGQFVATFTLTRVALFLVVPLQTALLPALTASLHSDDRAVLRRWLRRLSVAVVAFGAVAMTIGFVAGPATCDPDLRRAIRTARWRRRPSVARRSALHRAGDRHPGAGRRRPPPPRGVELALRPPRRGGGVGPGTGADAACRAGLPPRLDHRLAGRHGAPPDRPTRASDDACAVTTSRMTSSSR